MSAAGQTEPGGPADPRRPADPGGLAPGRLAPGPQPRRLREWPIAVVLVCVAGSLGIVAADHFRRGTYALALSVLLATGLRLVLPTRDAGVLAVRSRLVDVLILGGTGAGMLVLAWLVPRPS